ncbi:MAG TPA: ABC transporter permease [Bryobacteraceae bacterium]
MIWIKRLLSTLRSSSPGQRLEREFEAHVGAREEEYRKQRVGASDAKLAAKRAFGPVQRINEEYRERRDFKPLAQLGRDLHFGFRNLRRSPEFALVALLSLALGIGVNSAIFTLLNGLVLDTLPVPHPERVVEVQGLNRSSGDYENVFSYPVYRELAVRNTIFEKVTAQFAFGLLDLQLPERRQRLNGLYVSGTYFDFLHATPYLGRLLNADDDGVAGAHRVCVLSYQLWRNAFGGNPRIVGTTISLNDKRIEVVGITKPEFTGLGLQNAPDLELPAAALDYLTVSMHRDDAHWHWLQIMAQLKPGISAQSASGYLTALAKHVTHSLPRDGLDGGYEIYRAKSAPRGFEEQAGMARPLIVLMSTVALVLLIACLNLANLLLARGQGREHEIAIRFSLGATRWSIVRQLMIENICLAAGGAVLGLAVAKGLVSFLLAEFNKGKTYGRLDLSLDWQVIGFTALVAVVATLLFGSAPAWVASTVEPGSGLKNADKGVTSHGRTSRLRRSLFLVQVTLTMVLLFAAGLFARSLRNLRTIDVAENPDHLVLAEINLLLGNGKLYAPESIWDELRQRVLQIPSVVSAAYGFPSPLSGNFIVSNVQIPGRQSVDHSAIQSLWEYVSPNYFQTLGIPLLAGRDFTSADRNGSALVAIVNRKFASTYFPVQNPIGKQFKSSLHSDKLITIVGVARDLPSLELTETLKNMVYQPMLQSPRDRQVLTTLLRGKADAFERQLAILIHHLVPAMPPLQFQTMAVQRDSSIAKQRMLALLSSVFGALALALSTVGLYGLVSYSVIRRTREIGIRVSVGASPFDVLSLFFREHLALVLAGAIVGSILALSGDQFIRSLLYGVPATDVTSLCVATGILLSVAAIAILVPASRATHVDPAEALRSE